jgi:hypothetical protein
MPSPSAVAIIEARSCRAGNAIGSDEFGNARQLLAATDSAGRLAVDLVDGDELAGASLCGFDESLDERVGSVVGGPRTGWCRRRGP